MSSTISTKLMATYNIWNWQSSDTNCMFRDYKKHVHGAQKQPFNTTYLCPQCCDYINYPNQWVLLFEVTWCNNVLPKISTFPNIHCWTV